MTREDGIGYCPECGRRVGWMTLEGAGGCEVHGRVFVNYDRPYPRADVRDANEIRIRKGVRVLPVEGVAGTVVDVTDEDADWDDGAQRAVALGPYVVVEYDDGTVERWMAQGHDRHGPYDGYYVCDDVEIDEDADRQP